MQNINYDKWDELRKYLLSCKGNNIFIHEVLLIMDDFDDEEAAERLRVSEKEIDEMLNDFHPFLILNDRGEKYGTSLYYETKT
jgi:hypothetical protein